MSDQSTPFINPERLRSQPINLTDGRNRHVSLNRSAAFPTRFRHRSPQPFPDFFVVAAFDPQPAQLIEKFTFLGAYPIRNHDSYRVI